MPRKQLGSPAVSLRLSGPSMTPTPGLLVSVLDFKVLFLLIATQLTLQREQYTSCLPH